MLHDFTDPEIGVGENASLCYVCMAADPGPRSDRIRDQFANPEFSPVQYYPDPVSPLPFMKQITVDTL